MELLKVPPMGNEELLAYFIQRAREGKLENTVWDNIPEEVYNHPLFPGLRNSDLSALRKSEEHLQAKIDKKLELLENPQKEPEHFVTGKAFHAFVLEPHLIDEKYFVGLDIKDYPNALVTSQDISEWIVRQNEQKINSNEKQLLSLSEELTQATDKFTKYQEDINKKITDIKTKHEGIEYKTKKMRNDIIKEQSQPLKDELQGVKERFEDLKVKLKEEIKEIKGKLSSINSESKGTKDELIKAAKAIDASVQIWDAMESRHYANNLGKTKLKPEQLKDIKGMVNKLKSKEVYVAAHKKGHAEVTVFFTYQGRLCRVRFDWICFDRKFIMDYKSCRNASLIAFRKTITKMNYDVQGSFYLLACERALGWNMDDSYFYFAAQEKEAPYSVAFYVLNPADIEVGREYIRTTLSNVATDYPDELQVINNAAYGYDIEARE